MADIFERSIPVLLVWFQRRGSHLRAAAHIELHFPAGSSTLFLQSAKRFVTGEKGRLSSGHSQELPVEDRIRFIEHRGRHVLLIDLCNLSSEELMAMGRLVPSYLATQAKGSVLLLADFTGSKFDRASLEVLKQAAVFDRPHLKKSAWVGAEALPKVFYDNIKAFSQRDLPTFKTREEALDWLVKEEPASAAS